MYVFLKYPKYLIVKESVNVTNTQSKYNLKQYDRSKNKHCPHVKCLIGLIYL